MKYITPLFLFLFMICIPLFSQEWMPGDPITDERDGQTYKTVVIGKQCWTAENMNIGTLIQSPVGGSLMKDNNKIEKYCWDDDNGNCDGTGGKMKRGGFYEWQEAMQFWGGQPILPVQGICPKGWHIPSNADWNELLNKLGGASAYTKMVKDGGSGFDALMTGYRCTVSGAFRVSAQSADTRTYFWTAEQTDAANAPFIELGMNSLTAISFYKSVGLCVRCLWDNQIDVKEPNLNLNIQNLDFGDINIGEVSTKSFDIENSGTADLEITKIEITNNSKGAYSMDNLTFPLIIPVAGKKTLNISFSPKDGSMYLISKINITSNAANGTLQSISLRGKGVTDVQDKTENGNLTLKVSPNPFSKSTIITYNLKNPESALVEINIVDISGNIISKLLNGTKSQGEYSIEYKNEKIAAGKYFVIAKTGNSTVQMPIIFEK
jgi:uncharacterized protein (TIGR02145 family)